MANNVVKKDGSKIPFDGEKIKAAVGAAAGQAGLSQDESDKLAGDILEAIVEDFKDRDEVATDAIREKIILELDMRAPAVSAAWKMYEERKPA